MRYFWLAIFAVVFCFNLSFSQETYTKVDDATVAKTVSVSMAELKQNVTTAQLELDEAQRQLQVITSAYQDREVSAQLKLDKAIQSYNDALATGAKEPVEIEPEIIEQQ